MLRTRLWMGALLIALIIGVLVIDGWLAPWFPFLFLLALGLGVLGCYELRHLLPPERRPQGWLCQLSVVALVVANWPTHVYPGLGSDPWRWLGGAFAAVVLAAFLAEMVVFQGPGDAVLRVALAVWIVAYLGFLPSFLVQLRWLADPAERVNLGA